MEEKVIELLQELSGNPSIKTTDSLQTDLALDSFVMVSMLVELEERFDIQLEESDMDPFQLTYVSDIVDLTRKYVGDICEKES